MDKIRVADWRDARRRDYLPTLDGWRAIAILLVILGHAMDDLAALLAAIGLSVEPGGMRFVGIHGVLIFFGLSGFLITSKLITDEQRHGRISLSAFYVRRAFRILPATLFFLLSVAALAYAGVLDVSAGRWFASLLFAANYSNAEYSWYLGHFWSLAVEEHFYLLWPLLFLWLAVPRRRLVWAVALACGVALWRAIDFKFQFSGSSAAMFMGRSDIRADHLLWGVAVALAYADSGWRPRVERLLRDRRVMVCLLSLLVLLLLVHDVDWKLKFVLLSIESLLVPLAILSTCLGYQDIVVGWLEAASLRMVGQLSFSIYLWQQLFFVWAKARAPALAAWQVLPLNVVAVFALAAFSFYCIEEPAIAFGRKVLARWPRRGCTAPALGVVTQEGGKS